MYQTDWSLAAVTIRLPDDGPIPSTSGSSSSQEAGLLDQLRQQSDNPQEAAGSSSGSDSASSSGRVFNLPLASLEGRPGVPKGSKLWATFLPLEMPKGDGTAPRGISSEWVEIEKQLGTLLYAMM
jgi:cytochrome c biogenesis protein